MVETYFKEAITSGQANLFKTFDSFEQVIGFREPQTEETNVQKEEAHFSRKTYRTSSAKVNRFLTIISSCYTDVYSVTQKTNTTYSSNLAEEHHYIEKVFLLQVRSGYEPQAMFKVNGQAAKASCLLDSVMNKRVKNPINGS